MIIGSQISVRVTNSPKSSVYNAVVTEKTTGSETITCKWENWNNEIFELRSSTKRIVWSDKRKHVPSKRYQPTEPENVENGERTFIPADEFVAFPFKGVRHMNKPFRQQSDDPYTSDCILVMIFNGLASVDVAFNYDLGMRMIKNDITRLRQHTLAKVSLSLQCFQDL